MQAKPADEGNAAENGGAHLQVNDDHVWSVLPVQAQTIGQALCLQDNIDASILEHLLAALQHDGMIVNDENSGHAIPPNFKSTRALGLCILLRKFDARRMSMLGYRHTPRRGAHRH
jgi:hypothetical protein